jgi:hypothetical protein
MATPKDAACGFDRKGKTAATTFDKKPSGIPLCPVCDELDKMREEYEEYQGETFPLWIVTEPAFVTSAEKLEVTA